MARLVLEIRQDLTKKVGIFMIKRAIVSLVSLISAGSLWASASQAASLVPESTATPAVQYSRDANYIYIKQPLRVIFDLEQQAALKQGSEFVAKQLQNISKAPALDPSGDLKALNDSVSILGQNLNQLVQLSGQLYGDVAPYGIRFFQAAPTAVIVFGGLEYDKNLLKLVSGGGSVMVGMVLVPMRVERVSIKNPQDRITYTTWFENSSLIVLPTVNAGLGATQTAANGTNKRFGVGVVWGTLNKASDLAGVTFGPSVTFAVGSGLNVKLLGLHNLAKADAVSNTILMIGVEKGELAAETHFNLGAIIDANSVLSGVTKFGSGVMDRISGQQPLTKTQ